MKSSLAKVTLALLSAVFILGCQDVGSGPVGPGGLEIQAKREKDPRKGDGSNTLAKLIITGGMTGPTVQPDPNGLTVPIDQEVSFGDGKNQFKIQAHANAIGDHPINLKMNLNVKAIDCGPPATGDDGALVVALLDKLNIEDLLPRRQLFVTVGKDGEKSDDHMISVFWDEDDGDSSFRMHVRPEKVLTEDFGDDTLPLTFTFTGGTVELRDVTARRPKDRFKITCSLADAPDIVMVLTPPPAQ